MNKSKKTTIGSRKTQKLKCHWIYRDASLNADDMASQSVRLKEEQLRKEEEKVNLISVFRYPRKK